MKRFRVIDNPTMKRYRVIDTMHKDHEQHLGDGVVRAVDDERVYLLEPEPADE